MIDDCKNSKKNNYHKDENPCLCECGKLCYNNKECCYLKSKDINIIQINDPTFFQAITSYDNLYLTAKEPDINTVGYEIEASSLQRPNDTLTIDESGVYSIYISLKYSFKFNENAKEGDIFRINFNINGNKEDIFTISNTVNVPEIIEGESEEIISTIQGMKLQIVGENLPYKINIILNEFDFQKTVLNQVLITDLVLIIEKVI